MKPRTKTTLTVIICVLATFIFTSALFINTGCIDTRKISSKSDGELLLDEVKKYINATYLGEVDEDALYQYAAKGMAASLNDPYTQYYTPDEFKEYIENTTGEYVGVGLVISALVDTNEIVAVQPYKDAPAYKAGILPGDIILTIDGTEYNGDMLDEAADALRGSGTDNPNGTTVAVTFKRGEEVLSTVITREEVHVATAESKMLEGDIGYMRIISFDSDTDLEAEAELEKLSASGMKKLILDLRDNGGGDFKTAIGVAGLFLDEGALVTYTQDKNEQCDYFYSEGKKTDCELTVLINGGSASAAEVVTGALKDNGRTKALIGEKTFGKGITQNIYKLSNGGGIKITVDKYYTPSGECIHEKGIEPDIETDLGENNDTPSTALKYEQDLQLQKAVELFR